MMLWFAFVASSSSLDEVDRWLLESSMVVRGEIHSIQFETPGSPDSRSRYQIDVTEVLKGRIDTGRLIFTAPGGGSIGSTNDFTLAYKEEIILFVPQAGEHGEVEYDWVKGHVLARFEGNERASLVSVVEEGNSRRPLAANCLLGDLQATAPVPASALLPGLNHQQRSFRRFHEIPLLDGCGWDDFLVILRERAALSQDNAQNIVGAEAITPDPTLTRRNWYEFREEMRTKYGSSPSSRGTP